MRIATVNRNCHAVVTSELTLQRISLEMNWADRRLALADEASFLSQEIKCGQKRQTEDREMIRLDAFEQVHAKTLELIGANAGHYGGTGGLDVGIEKPVAECTHGHARNLHRFVQHLAGAYKRNGRMQLMRLAGKRLQLRAYSRNVSGFIKAPLTQNQSLIGAEHQPTRHADRNGVCLLARQQCGHVTSRIRNGGAFNRTFVDVSGADLDRNSGRFQERTPWRALRCQHQRLVSEPERHHTTGRRRRSVSRLSTAAAVSSIDRRVTSIEGQLCLAQSLRE